MTPDIDDPELPHLREAFDMAAVTAAVDAGFPGLMAEKSCRLECFRYRAGARATFQYECLDRQGSVQWITGTLWPRARGLKKFAREQGLQGLAYSHDLDMLLEAFPLDTKIPAVKVLVADPATVIASVLNCKVEVQGPVVPVRYRPHTGCVFRASAIIQGVSRKIYIKLYADDDINAVAPKLAAFPDGDTFRILRPLGWCAKHKISIWPELPGVPLVEAIRLGSLEQAARAATGLAEFHASNTTMPAISPYATVRAEAERAASFIAAFLPGLDTQLRELAISIPNEFGPEPVGLMHHDMKPEHVLLTDSCAQLIDVEGIANCDPMLDIGNMIARIEALEYLEGLDGQQCSRAASTFCQSVADRDQRKLLAAIALAKLKLAVYAISHQLYGWRELAVDEVHAASDIVFSDSVSSALSRSKTTASPSSLLLHC